ncbi:MAG TPA: ABC transporter permease [Candidatus Dormibacteraeota bacterium]|jgi:ABC-type dipeptide/oligopeptide/nickel transport system permease component|nr:ABC transporter permease [Candidatus Dormibacteraeota bacterium]
MRITTLGSRLLSTLLVMLAITIFVFLVMRWLPGDPVDRILGGSGQVSQQQLRALRASYHLDQPVPLQLVNFLGDLLHGDIGESVVYNRPASQVILEHLPATAELAVAATFFAIGVAAPLGVAAAVWRGSWFDRLASAGSYLGISMPGFWLGIALILVFAVHLRWLPVGGRADPGAEPAGPTGFLVLDAILHLDLTALASALAHLILPAVTMGSVMLAVLSRVLRSSMIEELDKEYVALALAKGASRRRAIVCHALRNALIPSVTVFGLELGTLLGGNMVVETVFGWPGVGQLAVSSIFARDYAVVQGVVLLYALTFAVINLLIDISYTKLDPRVSF